jgi:hypothetical protein
MERGFLLFREQTGRFRVTDDYLTAACPPSVCRRKSLTRPAISSGFS